MSHFRDHADAMRVIGHTFGRHQLYDQPSQSWLVRATREDGSTESAYHFTITWLPGRCLIVTGDIGEAVYSGITHLSDLDSTVRLMRETCMDYLSRKSTHKKEFDHDATARLIVEIAYDNARHGDCDRLRKIVDESACFNDPGNYDDRKEACRELMNGDHSEQDLCELADDWEIIVRSWPAAAHWHYAAIRTWADLMARQRSEAKKAEATAAKAVPA